MLPDSDIKALIAAQTGLIAALDSGRVAEIEVATAAVSRAVAIVRASGAMPDVNREHISHALKQSEALRTRVNYLADRNRQKIDRLAERNGVRYAATYNAAGVYGAVSG